MVVIAFYSFFEIKNLSNLLKNASIGSKTGINLNSIKNQIGLFSDPLSVIVDTEYLKTLSKREINSGYAEIFKHSIISNSNFKKLVDNPHLVYNEEIISYSIELKNKVVMEDKFEKDVRKHLNFGHTIGHAIESHFMNKKNKLLHGEAIAIGMICESYISNKIKGLELDKANEIKGIIPERNQIVGEYIQNEYHVPLKQIGVITGPCHAEEVALERLSYLTIACETTSIADLMANQLRCRYIKTTTSDDIYGTEYSAVLKNVIAVSAGIAHGLGYGDNYLSVLISNAIREINRFVDAIHPISRDIKDSAYLGDLLVTAYSKFSRNRMFGTYIGKGYSVKMAQMDMKMVAEGYYAVKCIKEMNKDLEVNMPITDAVHAIIYEKMSPRIEFKLLSELLD